MKTSKLWRTRRAILGTAVAALLAAPAVSVAAQASTTAPSCVTGANSTTTRSYSQRPPFNSASFKDGFAVAGFSVSAPSCPGIQYTITLTVPSGAPSSESFIGWTPDQSFKALGSTPAGPPTPVPVTYVPSSDGTQLTFTFNGDGQDVGFQVQLHTNFAEPTSFAGYTAVSGARNSALYCPSGALLGTRGRTGNAGSANGGMGGSGGAGGSPGCGSNGGNGGNGGNGAIGASGGAGGAGGPGGCQPGTPGEILSGAPPCNGSASTGGAGGNGGNAATDGNGGSGGAGGSGGYTSSAPGGRGGNGQNGSTGVAGTSGASGADAKPFAPNLDASATGMLINATANILVSGQEAPGTDAPHTISGLFDSAIPGGVGGGFW